jgi:outer membrane receptor protein involved in Fe transport
VDLFNQASEVEETRLEAFTTYTRQVRPDLLVEASIDLEASELTQTGADVRRSRDFFFARPRVVLRYDSSDQVQLRGRVERTVNQLDFGAFTASFTNDDNRLDVIDAGNPELVPEKAWNYELTYERRLADDAGFVSVTGTYRDVEDKEGRIPLFIRAPSGEIEERTAPGNIGDGREIRLEVSASVRLGWLNLDRAVLEGSVDFTDTQVTDPFTGEEREFDFTSPYGWRLTFRHDTTWRGFSYGVETGNQGPSEQFDLDYRQIGEQDVDLELFAEVQPLDNLTVRLEIEEALRAESERERFQYVGNRGDGVLERRELLFSEPLQEITLSVEGVF